MDETTVFDDFYAQKIGPALPRLRAECKQADAWKLTGVIVCLLGMGSFFGYYAEVLSGPEAGWLCFLFAVLFIVSVYKYTQRKDRFTDDFKAAIIKTVIDEVCPGLVYKPGETIRPRDYKTSSLYRYRYDYFDGDDRIEGVINNVPFHCAELHTRSDYGRRQVTVFKGLFFVAKINSRFNGGTYAWPRHRAQLATSVMDEHYRLLRMPHTQDINFGDEFSRHFRVCTTYPEQAGVILDETMRNKILEVNEKLKIPVSISFAAGKCFIGIPVADDLLEPTDYDPGDKEEIRKYFITVQLITNVVSGLPLSGLQ